MEQLTKFYKGEDIHITLGAFQDAALKEPGTFEGYGVDVLLYTSNEEQLIPLSSEAPEGSDRWMPLHANPDGTLDATISKGITEGLDAGVVRLEVRLTNKADRKSFIASKTAFMLIESRIANFIPCMSE